MKELSIEQKAKAYDEAIEKAKSLLSGNQLGNAWIYKLLPELKESEDEKIKKGILELVRQSTEILDKQNQNKMIAWLEEQGKKMSDPRYSILDKLIEADDIYQMSVNDEMIETAKNKAIDTLSKLEITKLLELEKQGERKTPQWMIDFLDNYRRNIGCSLDYDEAKDVDGKILCIKEWLEKQGEMKNADKFIEEEKPLLEKFKQAVYDCAWEKVTCKKEGETKEEYANRWAEHFLLMVRDWADDYIDFTISQKERNSYNKGYKAAPEKQGEQKSTGKAEPKFRNGQWIVWQDKCYKVNYNGCGYELVDQNGLSTSLEYGIINENAHLWTIKDAKDGDILFQDLMDGMTFIYCGINPNMAILYSFIISNDGKDVLSYHIGKPNTGIGNIEENKNIIHPATKEQRDLLFAKMKEAGYEWDVNKKQLERIIDEKQIKKNLQDNSFRRMFEQNPAWSEEDEKRIENILRVLDVQVCWGSEGKANPYQKEIDWLNYLKNRVEVKDVDLAAEISHYIKQHQSELKGYYDIRRIARHFFELGIKARKG